MEVDSEEERSRSLQEIDMTLAADEAQGMPMAQNYDVFDGNAYTHCNSSGTGTVTP